MHGPVPSPGEKGGKMFSKLIGRMAEKGFSRESVAKVLGVSTVTFRRKLNGENDWKLSEVYRLISLLEIPYEEIFDYFFAPLNF